MRKLREASRVEVVGQAHRPRAGSPVGLLRPLACLGAERAGDSPLRQLRPTSNKTGAGSGVRKGWAFSGDGGKKRLAGSNRVSVRLLAAEVLF